MKKNIICIAIIFTIIGCYYTIYASNIINNTRNGLVSIYEEVTDMDNMLMNDTTNNIDTNVDGLSIGLIVADIVVISGVVLYYLVPKK